jgi:hypothetical protein
MANGTADLHREVLQVLLEKIEEDPYPSGTMMDMAEQLLRDEEDVGNYAHILMDKVRADTFPSIGLLRRITAFG